MAFEDRAIFVAVAGCSQAADPVGAARIFCVRAIENVRRKRRRVNSIFLVQLRKSTTANFAGFQFEVAADSFVAARTRAAVFVIAMEMRDKSVY
jgi:hypothetical protein